MIGRNSMGTDMLQPFLIYKGLENPAGRIYQALICREGYPLDLQYAVQKAAWMDKLWKPPNLAKGRHMRYLLLDEC
jgi:hypothetical protein